MGQNFSIPEEDRDAPASHLDLYDQAIESTVEDDEVLKGVNLGLGNYSTSEYWQQVNSFHQSTYAIKAFERRLHERAVAQTKRQLALNGWNWYDEDEEDVKMRDGWNDLDEDEKAEKDRRRYLEERGDVIWSALNDDERAEAYQEFSRDSPDWTPPHLRMLMMRHDASRSRGARLLDNIFGRVKHIIGKPAEESAKKGRVQR